jgi:hypothetical protein
VSTDYSKPFEIEFTPDASEQGLTRADVPEQVLIFCERMRLYMLAEGCGEGMTQAQLLELQAIARECGVNLDPDGTLTLIKP